MNIMEILPTLGQPRGTSRFEWSCWGEHAQYIDWGGEDNHIGSAVFDRNTGLIYCLELFTGSEALRYLDPDFSEGYHVALAEQDIDPEGAYEGQPYTDIQDPQIILALLATISPEGPPNDPT
jgi:hypothetical protein